MTFWTCSAPVFLVSVWMQCSYHSTQAYLATNQCIWGNLSYGPLQGPIMTDVQVNGMFKQHCYEPSTHTIIKPDSESVPKKGCYNVYAITRERYLQCYSKCINLAEKPAGATPTLVANAYGMKFNVEIKGEENVPGWVWLAMKNGDTWAAVMCRKFVLEISRMDPTASDCWYVRSDNQYQYVTGIGKDGYYMIPSVYYNEFYNTCKSVQNHEAVFGASTHACFWSMDDNKKVDCSRPSTSGKKTMRFQSVQNAAVNRLAAYPAGSRKWKPPGKPTTRRPRQYPLGRNQKANKQPSNANAALQFRVRDAGTWG